MGRRVKRSSSDRNIDGSGHADTHALKTPTAPSLQLHVVLATVLFITGAISYNNLEKWSLLDSFYATTGVMTTVGIVMRPSTLLSRWFTVALNLASMGTAFSCINDIRNYRVNSWKRILGHSQPSVLSTVLPDFLAALGSITLCAWAYTHTEGWSWHESLYVTVCCATGLGLEETAPHQPISRIIFMVFEWSVMGCAISFCASLSALALGPWEGLWNTVWDTLSSVQGKKGGMAVTQGKNPML